METFWRGSQTQLSYGGELGKSCLVRPRGIHRNYTGAVGGGGMTGRESKTKELVTLALKWQSKRTTGERNSWYHQRFLPRGREVLLGEGKSGHKLG